MSMKILMPLLETAGRLRWLILTIGLLYTASLAGGVLVGQFSPAPLQSLLAQQDQRQLDSIEGLFGRFRAPVREGRLATILGCSGLVFLLNLFGSCLSSLSSVFLVTIPFTLVLGGCGQGASLAQLHASSSLSLFLFLLMGGLEWITYPLATVAGANVGLSVLWPNRQNVVSRWLAFKLSCRDAGRLYLLIALILAVQAVFEMLYVRKVLLMGGTGVPLMPW